MTGHTKEPWAVDPLYFRDVQANGFEIATLFADYQQGEALRIGGNIEATETEARANARRIVDCVNALAGIENPAAFVEAARGMEAMLMEAIERIEAGDLGQRMCCDGQMCGCQGSTNAEHFLHFANQYLTAFRAQIGEASNG